MTRRTGAWPAGGAAKGRPVAGPFINTGTATTIVEVFGKAPK